MGISYGKHWSANKTKNLAKKCYAGHTFQRKKNVKSNEKCIKMNSKWNNRYNNLPEMFVQNGRQRSGSCQIQNNIIHCVHFRSSKVSGFESRRRHVAAVTRRKTRTRDFTVHLWYSSEFWGQDLDFLSSKIEKRPVRIRTIKNNYIFYVLTYLDEKFFLGHFCS